MSAFRNREAWAVEGVLHGADKTFGASLLRLALTPLAWLHYIGLELYLLPFHLGWRKRYRLPVPVVSLGNLSSGGTGKTPATALIAGHLRDSGKRVVILSRGHRGRGEQGSEPRVVSDGDTVLLSPDEAGDEPVLLASLLPTVPVIVCRDRRKSGRLAVERFAPDIIVLDDGLQYWQLHRDLDIVLLDARRPFDNGFVLPRGLLREPPSHLSRAGIVILTRANQVREGTALQKTMDHVQSLARPKVPVLTATHAPVGWIRPELPETVLPMDTFVGRKAVVFSGIADDAAFARAVSTLGIDVVATLSFGDHHEYSADDIARIRAICPPDAIALTTEKDLVKIVRLIQEEPFPLAALRISLEITDVDKLYASLDCLPR